MAGQRFEGDNLEEALARAAETLDAPLHQIDYHVVVEKRGFLGGIKRLVIEAVVNPAKPAPVSASAPVAPAAPQRPAPRTRESREPRERGAREGRGGRTRERDRRGDWSDEPRSRERRPRRSDSHEEVPPQGEMSAEAERVAQWARELFDLSDFDVEIRTFETDDAIQLRIYGPDSGRLTERSGELLDSAQLLANKSLAPKGIEKRIEFDARGFKSRRSADLEQDAKNAADRVRAEGHEELLPPMSPVERRIVHVTLQDDPDVATVSRGEGYYKRVAVVPRHEADESGPAEREP